MHCVRPKSGENRPSKKIGTGNYYRPSTKGVRNLFRDFHVVFGSAFGTHGGFQARSSGDFLAPADEVGNFVADAEIH